MNAAARLAAFGVGLAAALAVGAGLGATIGPDPATPAPKPALEADGCPPAPTAEMEHGSS